MYEQFIAQIIIEKIVSLIIAAFAQLDGNDSDDFSELYLTLEENKQDIARLSGLSTEVIDKLTALIGEKAAATIGADLINSNTKNTKAEKVKRSKAQEYDKRKTAQKILRAQLLTIITNKIGAGTPDKANVTLAELKLANIISNSVLKKVLENKNITMKTKVEISKIQSIITSSMNSLVQLISNNGQVSNQAVKISRQTNIIEQISSELNIMSTSPKGIGSELFASPDITPQVDKDTGRGR